MRMDIDEAGCDGHAARVDLTLGRAVYATHIRDDAVADGDIAGGGPLARSVDELSASNHNVMSHFESPVSDCSQSLRELAQLGGSIQIGDDQALSRIVAGTLGSGGVPRRMAS